MLWLFITTGFLLVFSLTQASPPGQTGERTPGTEFRDCADCPELVVIPSGSFQMGSPASEAGREDVEGPVHTVHIGSFAAGKYPVTKAQWRQFVKATGHPRNDRCNWEDPGFPHKWEDPGFTQGDDHPVVCVTFQDATDYAAWLSKKTGHRYRLLSESEYEYVNRAGTSTAYWWGATSAGECEHVNALDASSDSPYREPGICNDGYPFTSPVGHFPANAFGLYDTTGNAESWVQDCFHAFYFSWIYFWTWAPTDGSAWEDRDCVGHVVRGSSWGSESKNLRSAARHWLSGRSSGPLHYTQYTLGLRVARTL
jgi:formylglycine-generating enzyme required for sulfatase activity